MEENFPSALLTQVPENKFKYNPLASARRTPGNQYRSSAAMLVDSTRALQWRNAELKQGINPVPEPNSPGMTYFGNMVVAITEGRWHYRTNFKRGVQRAR